MRHHLPAFLLFLVMLLPASALPLSADSVEPLLEGWVRDQVQPFNSRCPIWKSAPYEGQRCKVGCVATALESIVSYYGRNVMLRQKLEGWNTSDYSVATLPVGTTIKTGKILKNYGDGTAESVGMDAAEYQEAVDEVATLSLACGLMAKMKYGVTESGADVSNLVEPLKSVFGWKTARTADSYNYTPQQWREMLKNELRNGRPILYTGYTMNIAGHAFVLDGFDENGRFHVNWGYNGAYDSGYYELEALGPFENPDDPTPTGIMQGFFCNQQALVLCPDAVDVSAFDVVQPRTGHEIAIEGIEMATTIPVGKYTPVTFTLYNTTDEEITSPFEVFTNAPTDDDPFVQGDYGALFGVTMQPYERRVITVHCLFSQKGGRTLRISPDDVTILADKQVVVTSASADKLSFGELDISRTSPSSVVFSVDVTNQGNSTSGTLITYCLMPSTEVLLNGDWRHYEYVYIPAGQSQRCTVEFKGIHDDALHLFALRCPWLIQQSMEFTMSEITDIHSPSSAPADAPYYDLLGRRSGLKTRGILIHRGKKVLVN